MSNQLESTTSDESVDLSTDPELQHLFTPRKQELHKVY